MKCNIPKTTRLSPRDFAKMSEALTEVMCCKCGKIIETMSFAYATLNFDKNRYENRLCEKCTKESEDTK
jgi:hypothetical protein